MPEFHVIPIDETIARRVRETLKDPIYGLPVRVEPATGYGPCRLCLRTFEAGELRILFLYNPFSAEQDADFAGPVFVHAAPCEPYAPDGAFPEEIKRLPIVLRAYDEYQRCVAQSKPVAERVDAALSELIGRADVAYIHVRNAEAKCFIARVEPAHVPADQPNVLISSR